MGQAPVGFIGQVDGFIFCLVIKECNTQISLAKSLLVDAKSMSCTAIQERRNLYASRQEQAADNVASHFRTDSQAPVATYFIIDVCPGFCGPSAIKSRTAVVKVTALVSQPTVRS